MLALIVISAAVLLLDMTFHKSLQAVRRLNQQGREPGEY